MTWREEIARHGDQVALWAVAAVCLLVSLLQDTIGPQLSWWAGAIVLMLVAKRLKSRKGKGRG